ncbi:hypothetical protein [Yoonia litorea]|uniref:Pilus formation protein N terminal region n=1 Tax=Yoonia litorea TaxID=1123755 RepID=A0A1I6MCX1_9RHOB|nr:hypothetical protein [Yoonia litorea]SFS13600.1 hypothetical protein SAMN05444714_1576 [Yoonia litorea]
MRVPGYVTAFTAIMAASAMPTSVSAGEIALTLKAQELTLVGEFAGYVDNVYVLITSTGTIYVPADLAICAGEGCIDPANPGQASG